MNEATDALLTSRNALMVRSSSGIHVALSYLPNMQIVALTVTIGNKMATTVLDDTSTALDAFEHPFCYLNAAQITDLFAKESTDA